MPPCDAVGARTSIGLLAGLAALASWGCMAIVDPDVGALGHPPAACQPGTQSPCNCQNGTEAISGFQLCNMGGGYDDCVCGSTVQQPTAGAPAPGPAGNKGKG